MTRAPCVYILASRKNGTLYVGVTTDIRRRMLEHRLKGGEGFTAKYGVTRLVHVEWHGSAMDAIRREKRMKKWKRAWKIALIESHNRDWRDLSGELW